MNTDEPKDGSFKAYIDKVGTFLSGLIDAQRTVPLSQNTGAAAFDTTTAETSVISGGAISIPAGTLKTDGDQINFICLLDAMNNSGSPVTQTSRFKIGGNTITGLNAYSLATNAFTGPARVVVTATRTSATTIVVEMSTELQNALNTGIVQRPVTGGSYTVSDLASNSLSLDFTWQMGTSHANARITPRVVVAWVERV